MTGLATRLVAARAVETLDQTVPATIPAGHVRLRLAVASLCGTDLHYYSDFANAGFALQNAVTLGHEACGWIEDPNGSDLVAGELVALNPIMNCTECAPCRAGEPNLCLAKKFPGSATTLPHLDGFFRQVIDHPARCCRPVRPGVDPRHLTFAEPLACALHALAKAGVAEGQEVLVTGCGPMGLLAIAAAAARGARVTAMDLRRPAVTVALSVGAEAALVPGTFGEESIARRFDAAIEASGAMAAVDTALTALRPKGRLSVLSFLAPSASARALHQITLKEITVAGSFQFNREFEDAVALIEAGAIDFSALTARAYNLREAGAALAFMASGEAFGKILLLGEGGAR